MWQSFRESGFCATQMEKNHTLPYTYIYRNGWTICQKFSLISFDSDSIRNSVTAFNRGILMWDAFSGG